MDDLATSTTFSASRMMSRRTLLAMERRSKHLRHSHDHHVRAQRLDLAVRARVTIAKALRQVAEIERRTLLSDGDVEDLRWLRGIAAAAHADVLSWDDTECHVNEDGAVQSEIEGTYNDLRHLPQFSEVLRLIMNVYEDRETLLKVLTGRGPYDADPGTFPRKRSRVGPQFQVYVSGAPLVEGREERRLSGRENSAVREAKRRGIAMSVSFAQRGGEDAAHV